MFLSDLLFLSYQGLKGRRFYKNQCILISKVEKETKTMKIKLQKYQETHSMNWFYYFDYRTKKKQNIC